MMKLSAIATLWSSAAIMSASFTMAATLSCNSSSCGPHPNYELRCPDGTIVGTGNCSFKNETQKCGYEFPKCPTPVCNDTSCGPRPLFLIRCWDGSTVGAGPCILKNATNSCGFEYPQCPKPACNITTCGPRPLIANRICPNGKTIAGPGPCSFNYHTQKCGYPIISCPICRKNSDCKPACNVTTCGTRPLIANRICPDGKSIAGPGPCSFNSRTQKCGYPIISCPTCKTNSDCKGKRVYCSTDGFCHAVATCASNRDCINSGNIYPVPAIIQLNCVLCTVCDTGVCRSKCTQSSNVCSSNFTSCKACARIRRVKSCLNCQSTCSPSV